VLLTILGYIPGIIYAVYVLVSCSDEQPQGDYYAAVA
jgi:hypothetical protein